MLELLQYATSDLWIFIGCFSLTMGSILCTGWAINAILIGFKGVKCDAPELP